MTHPAEDSRAADRRDSQHAAVADARHDAYWRKRFASRPYTDESRGYEHYRPAYRFGWESRARHGDRAFEEIEAQLESQWDPGSAGLEWDEARLAVRDAYSRVSGGEDNTDAATPGNPLV